MPQLLWAQKSLGCKRGNNCVKKMVKGIKASFSYLESGYKCFNHQRSSQGSEAET